MSIEAMKQALEALEDAVLDYSMGKGAVARHTEAITALRTAIEQAERYEDEKFKPDWMNYQEGFAAGVLEGREQMKQVGKPATRPATREEKIVNPGVYEVPVQEQIIRKDERDRLARACAKLPFGDTAASFAAWIAQGGSNPDQCPKCGCEDWETVQWSSRSGVSPFDTYCSCRCGHEWSRP